MVTKCICNQIDFHTSTCHLTPTSHPCTSNTTHKCISTSHLRPWLFLMVGTRHTLTMEKSIISIIKPAQRVGSTHQPHPITNIPTHMLGSHVPWEEQDRLHSTPISIVLDCTSRRYSRDNISLVYTSTSVLTNNSICSSKTRWWLGAVEKSTECLPPSIMIHICQAVATCVKHHTIQALEQQSCLTRLNLVLSTTREWTLVV